MPNETTMEQEKLLFQVLAITAERYLERLGVKEIRLREGESAVGGGVRLQDVTAFIQISGAVQGGFILSVDKALSHRLAKLYMIEDIGDEEAAGCAVEVVAEIANVITGNALADREEYDIFLGNPLMIVAPGAGMQAGSLCVRAYATEDGAFECMLIPMENKAELASIIAVSPD